MARENLGRVQCQVFCQCRAGIGEQAVEDPAHGEYSWPGIHTGGSDRNLPHFPAGSGRALQHRHVGALARQVQRGCQTAHTRTDNDDPVRFHAAIKITLDVSVKFD